jgi:RsiW-degrading membrane proteinase PrsW (M82 family)
MNQIRNPYRRSIDPESDALVLWTILMGVLLLMIVGGFLYAFSGHPTQSSYQTGNAAFSASNATRQ